MIEIQLKPDVAIHSVSEEEISLSFLQRFHEEILRWKAPSSSMIRCFKQLISGVTEKTLIESWGDSHLHLFYSFFYTLKEKALLCYTLKENSRSLVTLIPHAVLQDSPFSVSQIWQISRFAFLRCHNGSCILESPRSFAAIEVNFPRCLEVIASLAKPQTISSLLNEHGWFSEQGLILFINFLKQGSFLKDEEEETPMLATWEFHDLIFHARSGRGRNPSRIGGTYRFANQIAPWPSIRPSITKDSLIPLFRPDLQHFIEKGPSFIEVLENRCSIREHGEQPISIEQFGEFLFISARVKQRLKSDRSDATRCYEGTKRPSPGGGACHELEIYPLFFQCEGIASGLYRYLPDSHALEPICITWNSDLDRLLQEAQQCTQKEKPPQILILIAARFQRVSWKYESIAYSTILKNAGALFQTFYLVATALDLAPCAVGVGDSDLFSKVTGLSYYSECTVAEFILGSKQILR